MMMGSRGDFPSGHGALTYPFFSESEDFRPLEGQEHTLVFIRAPYEEIHYGRVRLADVTTQGRVGPQGISCTLPPSIFRGTTRFASKKRRTFGAPKQTAPVAGGHVKAATCGTGTRCVREAHVGDVPWERTAIIIIPRRMKIDKPALNSACGRAYGRFNMLKLNVLTMSRLDKDKESHRDVLICIF